MQYWVHINGQQQGPMQIDELARMGITSDTYVWREGLEDWVKASELEELSRLFVAPAVPDSNGEIAAFGSENCSQQAIDTQDANPVEGSGAVTEEESGQPSSCQASSSVVPPEVPAMEPQPMPYVPQPQFAPQYMPQPQRNMPPCPPTNLAWAIIVTVLCCQLFGIVAIVYAAQVRSKYDMGQYDKAEKYSERAALWCQLAIALGLVWITFYSVMSPIFGLF